jgi:hypothetical protein
MARDARPRADHAMLPTRKARWSSMLLVFA